MKQKTETGKLYQDQMETKINKQQKLKLVAYGFFGALGHVGAREMQPAFLDFDFHFEDAWEEWIPRFDAGFRREFLPTIDIAHPATAPRNVLWRADETEFKIVHDGQIAASPRGLTHRQFVEIHAGAIPFSDWVELAELYVLAQRNHSD